MPVSTAGTKLEYVGKLLKIMYNKREITDELIHGDKLSAQHLASRHVTQGHFPHLPGVL